MGTGLLFAAVKFGLNHVQLLKSVRYPRQSSNLHVIVLSLAGGSTLQMQYHLIFFAQLQI
jgi:hypothetical protein